MNRRQTPLERLRLSGISPERALGQNFLIDPNILDVIERAASLKGSDVVLEVGPGLGVLSERLLDRCRAVHCIEVDRRLADLLEAEFGGSEGFRLYLADAMRFDFTRLVPPPDKFVANLPYNVAAPLVIKSIHELPAVNLWCLLVQKEIANRLFAGRGTALYGGVSVITQLFCRKESSRPVSAKVFYPPPRVQSTLLVFRRRPEAAEGFAVGHFEEVKEIVYAAFSHRRKKLINSLSEADPAPRALAGMSEAARRGLIGDILEGLRTGTGVRAQELKPGQFEQMAKALIDRVA